MTDKKMRAKLIMAGAEDKQTAVWRMQLQLSMTYSQANKMYKEISDEILSESKKKRSR